MLPLTCWKLLQEATVVAMRGESKELVFSQSLFNPLPSQIALLDPPTCVFTLSPGLATLADICAAFMNVFSCCVFKLGWLKLHQLGLGHRPVVRFLDCWFV